MRNPRPRAPGHRRLERRLLQLSALAFVHWVSDPGTHGIRSHGCVGVYVKSRQGQPGRDLQLVALDSRPHVICRPQPDQPRAEQRASGIAIAAAMLATIRTRALTIGARLNDPRATVWCAESTVSHLRGSACTSRGTARRAPAPRSRARTKRRPPTRSLRTRAQLRCRTGGPDR
jgi:hypothetical protein